MDAQKIDQVSSVQLLDTHYSLAVSSYSKLGCSALKRNVVHSVQDPALKQTRWVLHLINLYSIGSETVRRTYNTK